MKALSLPEPRRVRSLVAALCALFCVTVAPARESLHGIWENSSRFIEIPETGGLRVVLKTWYGFVYDDSPLYPATVEPLSASSWNLSVREPLEREYASIPLAVAGNGLYTRFYYRYSDAGLRGDRATAARDATQGDAQSMTARSIDSFVPFHPLEGLWLGAGNTDAIRRYRAGSSDEVFAWLFYDDRFIRVRYWKTDARFRDMDAHIPGEYGRPLAIPKFIEINGNLFTCISGTGRVLRTWEKGRLELEESGVSAGEYTVRLVRDTPVYGESASLYLESQRVRLSADGTILALGEPWAVRSAVPSLDAEITAHNAKRRPGRKPLVEYLDLDFRWDDIARIRNKGARVE